MDVVDSTLLSVLARRHDVLERLSSDPTRKCELATELSVSRSTIDRGIRELEQHDLIERDGRAYETTLAGELTLSEYERFERRLSDIVGARELLSALPSTAALDPAFLEGADVIVSRRTDPERPAYYVEDLLESATHQRAYTQSFLDHLVALYREAILDGLECEVALTPAVLDRLVARHRESIAETLSSGNVSLRETEDSLPFCLSVTRNEDAGEATAMVSVFVDEGLKGIVANDHPRAVEWAETTLTSVWNGARPLSFPTDAGGRR